LSGIFKLKAKQEAQPDSRGNPPHANKLKLLNFRARFLDITPH